MITEVAVRKTNAFGRLQVGACEDLVARIAAFPTIKFPDVFRHNFYGCITLILFQVVYLDRRLKYRKVLTDQSIALCVK